MVQTSFINVDIELSSIEDLSIIAKELEGQIFLLQNEFEDDIYRLSFECSLSDETASSVIERFLSLLDSLTAEQKMLIANCSSRILDIGYESGDKAITTNLLPASLLRRLSEYEINLVITLYPLDQENEQETN